MLEYVAATNNEIMTPAVYQKAIQDTLRNSSKRMSVVKVESFLDELEEGSAAIEKEEGSEDNEEEPGNDQDSGRDDEESSETASEDEAKKDQEEEEEQD